MNTCSPFLKLITCLTSDILDKSSLLRNAKIRLSNIHPGRLLMNLRGQAKWIK